MAVGAGYKATDALEVTVLTSGYSAGYLTSDYVDESPAPDNRKYTDTFDSFGAGDLISEAEGEACIFCPSSAATYASTDGSWSYVIPAPHQCVVWHSDDIDPKPSWLTDNWSDTGHDITLQDQTASGYVRDVAASATVSCGGNTDNSAAGNDMYLVSLFPTNRRLNPASPRGQVQFQTAADSTNEGGTATITIVRTSGAQGTGSVQISDGGTGQTASEGTDYQTFAASTVVWSNEDGGNKSATLTTVARAGDQGNRTVVFTLSSASGVSLGSPTTHTHTIVETSVAEAIGSATYYVRPTDGSDSDSGLTSASAFATLAKAVSIWASSNTIEIQATASGGSINLTEAYIPLISGVSGAPNVLRGRAGDTVTLSEVTGNIVDIDDVKYHEIHNINVGDVSKWSQSDAGGGYKQTRSLKIHGSAAYILISGGVWTGAKGWIGNEIGGNAHHVKLNHMRFSHHGTNADPSKGADKGDMLQITGDNVIATSCSTEFCGHNSFVAQGNKNVFLNNYFDGSWIGKGTGFPGARCAVFTPSEDKQSGGSPFGPQFIMGNHFKNSDESEENSTTHLNTGIKLKVNAGVCIFNMFYNNTGPAISQGLNTNDHSSAGSYIRRNQVWHNTFHNCGQIYKGAHPGGSGVYGNNNHELQNFGNNVFQAITSTSSAIPAIVDWHINQAPLDGHANHWKGSKWINNSWRNTAGTSVNVRLTGSPANGTQPAGASANSFWSNNWFNNRDEVEIFVSASARSSSGFALTSASPGHSAAVAIASVVGAYNGLTITVSDAAPFPDAYDLGYFGHLGVRVAIGANAFVRVTSQNLSADQLTVDATVSGASGDGIFYVINSATAHHMGAVQQEPA